MNYKELREIMNEKNISLEDLIGYVPITRAGLHRAVDNQTIKLRDLKRVCDFMRITPALFFEPGTYHTQHKPPATELSSETEYLHKEIEYLKEQLRDKNEIIELLREKNTPYGFVAESSEKPKLKEYGKEK